MMEEDTNHDYDDTATLLENDELSINNELTIEYENNNNKLIKNQVGLKRQVNLLSSISLIIGLIIGSGIFASPKNVAIYAGSTGAILLVWVGCGVIAIFAGLTWCELGTMFPNSSGSEYSYLVEAFGPLLGFMYLFTSIVALQSSGLAMVSLVCGEYILTAFGHTNQLHSKLIAAAVIVIVSFVNSVSVQWAMRFQNVFTTLKLAGITMLVITGLVRLVQGHNENFIDAFNGTETDISKLSYAFYGGLWSYSGWNGANFIIAESVNPSRDIPLTILIGIPFIIFCYVMVNVAYLTVLTPLQITNSGAVAVTVANQLYGKMAWVMPLFVACSVIGSANGGVIVSGRMVYDGAKRGHMPKFLAMLHTQKRTPIPAILFNAFIALLILIPKSSTFITLTNYSSFAVWMFFSLTTVGLLRLRYRRPNIKRPFKVFIGVPIILFICSIYLVVAPFYENPKGSSLCLLFILCAVPIYYTFIKYTIIPKRVVDLYNRLTLRLQLTFNLSMPDINGGDGGDKEGKSTEMHSPVVSDDEEE